MTNRTCSTTWLDSKNGPFGPQKAQNDPKIRVTTKVLNEGSTENKSLLAWLVDPKTVFETYPGPKNCAFGSQKAKVAPELSQIKSQNWRKQEWNKMNKSSNDI